MSPKQAKDNNHLQINVCDCSVKAFMILENPTRTINRYQHKLGACGVTWSFAYLMWTWPSGVKLIWLRSTPCRPSRLGNSQTSLLFRYRSLFLILEWPLFSGMFQTISKMSGVSIICIHRKLAQQMARMCACDILWLYAQITHVSHSPHQFVTHL